MLSIYYYLTLFRTNYTTQTKTQVVGQTIESFGFEDENDYEYEIFATLGIARAWARITLAGKKRRHSTTSFSVNVVVAEELSHVTRFLILRSEEALTSFNKDNSANFSGES